MFNNEDVLSELQKRTEYSDRQLRFIMVDFYHALINYLQHPEDHFYRGIIIRSCIKFRLNPAKVLQAAGRRAFKKKNLSNVDINILKYHKILLEYDQYTQKQKRRIEDDERYVEISKTGEGGEILHGAETAGGD